MRDFILLPLLATFAMPSHRRGETIVSDPSFTADRDGYHRRPLNRMKDESEARPAVDIMTHNGNLSPDGLTKRQDGLFSYFLAPAMQVKPWATFSIRKAYEYITTDMDALTATYRLRDIHDEKERRLFKKRAFAFCTFSGIFAYRSRDGLLSHSGLLCIDIDHVGNHLLLDDLRKRLIDDEQFLTELCFVSPSGDGLKWVVSINTELYPHELWFDATRQYLLDRYGIDADKACRDVSRACFLPHDPGCYVRG